MMVAAVVMAMVAVVVTETNAILLLLRFNYDVLTRQNVPDRMMCACFDPAPVKNSSAT